MEPLGMLVGAGILGIGMLTGHITGRRAAARQRPEPPPEPICGCTHHRSLHDVQTGECHGQVEHVIRGYGRSYQGNEWRRCTCRQYVGPEPITSFWTPPVLPEGTDSPRM